MDIAINIISYILIPLWIIGVYEFAKNVIDPMMLKKWRSFAIFIIGSAFFAFAFLSLPDPDTGIAQFTDFSTFLKFYIPTFVTVLVGLRYSKYNERIKKWKKRNPDE